MTEHDASVTEDLRAYTDMMMFSFRVPPSESDAMDVRDFMLMAARCAEAARGRK